MKTPRSSALFVLIAASGAAAALSPSENASRLALLDRDSDQQISRDEVLLGLLNFQKEGKIDFSLPLDASRSRAAIERLPGPERLLILEVMFPEFEQRRGVKEYYRFDELDAAYDFRLPAVAGPVNEQPLPAELKPSFLLRRNLEKMPAGLAAPDTTGTELKKADKLIASGAMFSWGWASGGERQVLAEGLFAYEKPFSDHWAPGTLGRWLFALGFHRVNFIGESEKPSQASPRFADETSLLAPSITYESGIDWPHSGGFAPGIVRGNLLATTDWDFESMIPTLELELTILHGRAGLGSFNTKSPHLAWRLDFVLHADAGHVANDGKWTKHVEGDTFAHIGPKVGLKLRPFPNSAFSEKTPVVIDLSWSQYEKLTSNSKLVRNASAEISWFLRKPGKGPSEPGVALTVAYKNLKNVENKKDDDSVISGIAVGF